MSFRGDTKSHWSLLSGVYAKGWKISHTRGKYMCNLSWTPQLLEKGNSKINTVYNTKKIWVLTVSEEEETPTFVVSCLARTQTAWAGNVVVLLVCPRTLGPRTWGWRQWRSRSSYNLASRSVAATLPSDWQHITSCHPVFKLSINQCINTGSLQHYADKVSTRAHKHAPYIFYIYLHR